MRGSKSRGHLAGFASRSVGVILFLVTLPVLAVVRLIRRKEFKRREVVRLPATDAAETWTTFPQEIEKLSGDWRAIYLLSRVGLITEAGVVHGSAATEDEVYSSEVYYSAMASPKHDLGLAIHFLARTVRNAYDHSPPVDQVPWVIVGNDSLPVWPGDGTLHFRAPACAASNPNPA